MAKIKLRDFKGKSIKTLNKRNVASSKYKENLFDIKEKDNESSVYEYGSNKIEYASKYAAKKFINHSKKIGNKSVLTTKNNIIKLKNKVKVFKEKLAKKKTIKKVVRLQLKVRQKLVKKLLRKLLKHLKESLII